MVQELTRWMNLMPAHANQKSITGEQLGFLSMVWIVVLCACWVWRYLGLTTFTLLEWFSVTIPLLFVFFLFGRPGLLGWKPKNE